jgi:HSP20 family protein
MSAYWFNQPFFSLNQFDRLFDEAFANRTQGANQSQNQLQRQQGAQLASGALRPRYVIKHTSHVSGDLC